jgi:inosine-uridine nucleoside N-ribohydrolase
MKQLLVVLFCALLSCSSSSAETPKVPVLLDTDIGGALDDALALGLALVSPEIDLRGITTVHDDAYTRALLVCRWLHFVGKMNIPVASGAEPRRVPDWNGQMQYGLRAGFRKSPEKQRAVAFLREQIAARPGELTLLAIGPLTNLAALFEKHPECQKQIRRIVVMGGALAVGYNGKPPVEAEWNFRTDVAAARVVLDAGVPLLVVPLDVTAALTLDDDACRRIFTNGTPLHRQLAALRDLAGPELSVLFDPLAVALCFDEQFCTFKEMRLAVDDRGVSRTVEGKANARVAVTIKREEFLAWFVKRLRAPDGARPVASKPVNVVEPVAAGKFPNLVHVVEDYETDIERRWWLAGKLETKNVPPGSTRACRAVLCNDFDEKQGDANAAYRAVICNPVPGPPMSASTRLRFRCWLKGTSRLRCQIYGLSNGYHRCLTLTDVPQGKWQDLAVDLTQARRPDGSGGPLAASERIDDIQFYTDPDAELLIDDIVLYDSAPPDETRPFPKHLHFTGWFDTGKQGQEWPGDFTIVPHQPPRTGKAARSVSRDKDDPWLRIHLRGERPLGAATSLRCRYHLTSATGFSVALRNSGTKKEHVVEAKELAKGEWRELVVSFPAARAGERVDEIVFRLPKGAELLVDDVLLYEPE